MANLVYIWLHSMPYNYLRNVCKNTRKLMTQRRSKRVNDFMYEIQLAKNCIAVNRIAVNKRKVVK